MRRLVLQRRVWILNLCWCDSIVHRCVSGDDNVAERWCWVRQTLLLGEELPEDVLPLLVAVVVCYLGGAGGRVLGVGRCRRRSWRRLDAAARRLCSEQETIIRTNTLTDSLTDDRLVSNMLTCAPALGLLGVAVSVVVCVGGFGRRYPLRGGLSLQALTSPVSWFGRVVRRLG